MISSLTIQILFHHNTPIPLKIFRHQGSCNSLADGGALEAPQLSGKMLGKYRSHAF
jgi:hypothetical protein